jgi:hypothetical protein
MKVKVMKESFVNNQLVYPGEVIEVSDDLKLADNLQKVEEPKKPKGKPDAE